MVGQLSEVSKGSATIAIIPRKDRIGCSQKSGPYILVGKGCNVLIDSRPLPSLIPIQVRANLRIVGHMGGML